MKPKILFCGYRDWSLKVHDFINETFNNKIELKLVKDEEEFSNTMQSFDPDITLFIGWSWIVDKDIVNKYICICLHPSPLPKYRGGSPLQHQIINGEEESAVTFFRMNEGIDKGTILWQENFSLQGNLNEIFERISEKGKKGAIDIIAKLLDLVCVLLIFL